MFGWLRLCLFEDLSFILSCCASVFLSAYVYPSVCVSVCLSVYLCVCLSISQSICLSACVYPSVCLSVYLCVCLSVCLSLNLSVCLSVCWLTTMIELAEIAQNYFPFHNLISHYLLSSGTSSLFCFIIFLPSSFSLLLLILFQLHFYVNFYFF